MNAVGKSVQYGSNGGVAIPQPCYLDLFVGTISGGGVIELYDGLDATSGRQIATFYYTSVVPTMPVYFGGLYLSRGLYVHSDTVSFNYTVVYHYPD